MRCLSVCLSVCRSVCTYLAGCPGVSLFLSQTELEEAEVASDSKMASTAQGTASTYHKVMERLRYLCRWASNLGAEDFNEWYDSMERISARIHKTPELQHVDIYNQLGMANAEAGSFDEAIKTFRESLTIDKNDHLAMEQLGNLLVRTAFQMFKDREEAERKPPGSGKVSTIKEAETKTGEVSEPPTASRQRSRSNSKENKRPMSRGSFTNAIQKRLDEGIAFLEKVVEMEVSDERLALLGSAYKRLFMLQNGFFPKARDYLKKAAGYYHKADIEQKRRKGDGCYAILNALSLDMLLGESKSADLLVRCFPLSYARVCVDTHVWLAALLVLFLTLRIWLVLEFRKRQHRCRVQRLSNKPMRRPTCGCGCKSQISFVFVTRSMTLKCSLTV